MNAWNDAAQESARALRNLHARRAKAADFLRSRAAPFRQLAYLRSNESEAFPRGASARRLDRRIECEKVRLASELFHDRDRRGDLPHRLYSLFHGLPALLGVSGCRERGLFGRESVL